mmetsp:Transcript_18455/g.56649  ORF Transcript_18455/g.56649 Transcript_18455/m.56649 type:complete len:110 (-) Transcript_18455:2261-2590(-)
MDPGEVNCEKPREKTAQSARCNHTRDVRKSLTGLSMRCGKRKAGAGSNRRLGGNSRRPGSTSESSISETMKARDERLLLESNFDVEMRQRGQLQQRWNTSDDLERRRQS